MMTKSIYLSLYLAFIFLFFSFSSAHNKTGHGHHKTGHGHKTSHEVSFNFNAKGCFSKVYAFGGSDIDTGNAHFLGGLTGGSGSFHSSSPVTDSTRRFSDGRLVVDFLCEALSLPHLSPYKDPSANSNNGLNFAVAGSTALSGDFFATHNLSSLIWNNVPLSFQTQIDWFDKYLIEAGCQGNGKGSCKADIENSLFWIGEMGVSDFISALGSTVLSLPYISEISVKIVCELLKTLLDNGAKYIVVQGLPPVGCLPAYMSSNSQQNYDHMGCVANANLAYLTILTNPKKYQIEEPFKACCGYAEGQVTVNGHSLLGSLHTSTCKDPQKFISWDGIHLTEAMNKHLANLFLNQGFCQPSFSEMVKSKLNM